MDDREFERLMEPLMEKIAEERIVPQNHKFSPDFEQKLLQKAVQEKKKELIEESVRKKTVQHQKHDARIKKSDPIVSKHYAFGGIAACILIAMTLEIMFHYSNEPELQQSTAVPMEVLESEHTAITMASAVTIACAEDRVTQTVTTVAADRTTLMTEQTQYEIESSAADTLSSSQITAQITIAPIITTVMQETTGSETTVITQTTVTTAQTTMTMPPTQTYELGDVDMDGKITFVDALLVEIDWKLAEKGMSAQSFLNDEQRALGDMDGQSLGRYWDGVSYQPEWRADLNGFGKQIIYEPYLLSSGDASIIKKMAFLRGFLGIDATVDEAKEYKYYDLEKNPEYNEPEKFERYQLVLQIYNKYSDPNQFECFFNENDNQSPHYSLEEFWTDMEILRTISV
jgi:hypothetical protein